MGTLRYPKGTAFASHNMMAAERLRVDGIRDSKNSMVHIGVGVF